MKDGRLPINALRNGSLSLEAKGLICILLDPGRNWEGSVVELMEVTGAGRFLVQRCIHELEAEGFLIRKQIRESGRFSSCEYTVTNLAFEI